MTIKTRLAALLIVTAAAFAGCTENPTGTSPTLSPSQPSYNGIGWFGSGNRTGTDSTAITPSNTGTITEGGGGTTGGTSTAGTGWFGSGN